MARLENLGESEKVFLFQPVPPSLCLPGARSLGHRAPYSVFPVPTAPSFGVPFSWGLASKKSMVFPDYGSWFFQKLTHRFWFPSPNWFLETVSPLCLVLRRGIPSLWPLAWVPPTQVCPQIPAAPPAAHLQVWAEPSWCRHCPRCGRHNPVPASTLWASVTRRQATGSGPWRVQFLEEVQVQCQRNLGRRPHVSFGGAQHHQMIEE